MGTYLAVGGPLDGMWFSDAHSEKNPICTSEWYYNKRQITIDREDGEKEYFFVFSPEHFSFGEFEIF